MKHLVQCLFAASIAAAIGLSGCAELRNGSPAPVAPGVQAHGVGWADSTRSPKFHGAAIRNASWDMRSCKTCHGQNYDGGTVNVSCRTCHTGGAGPENCATCHGSANNPAPPRDLKDSTTTSVPGVGAHQRHLNGGGATTNVSLVCANCHVVPATVYTPGHLDNPGGARVVISGGLSVADPSGVPGPPAYSRDSLKCSNTYCHGNWTLTKSSAPVDNWPWYADSVIAGGNRAVLWIGGSAEVACGKCHGLPPAGHYSSPSVQAHCDHCHWTVVGSDGRTIIDKSKHMNGKVDVFNDPERNF